MAPEKSHLNSRAAIWATLIVGAALVILWVPQLIWPSNGSPNILAFILSVPGIVVLIPGVMITSFVHMVAYMVIHHAEIARQLDVARANSPNGSGVADSYFVADGVGFHWSITFACAIILDWIFYFLIARTVIRARGQRADN